VKIAQEKWKIRAESYSYQEVSLHLIFGILNNNLPEILQYSEQKTEN